MRKTLMRAAIAYLLAMIPAIAQLGIGLSPMRTELGMRPGQSYSGAMELTNELGGEVRIRAELLDFLVDASMTPQFERSIESEQEWSCRGWLTVNPMETVVTTSEKLVARYTVRVPAEAKPRAYHCAVGFVTLPSPGQQYAMGIRTAVRAVSAIYIVVGQPQPKGEISGLDVEENEGKRTAVIRLRNDSDYHFRPTGKLEVLDAGGQAIETHDVPPFPVLPRREQRFLVPGANEAGKGAAMRLRVDLGLGEIQEATVRLRQ